MNCPNCGLQITSDQQFCRSCGTELGAGEPRRGFPLAMIGLLLAFGGIIIALFGRMIFQMDVLVFIGVIISITGMFSVALFPMISAMRREKKKTSPKTSAEQLAVTARVEPTMKLPPMNASDSIHSVVDNTTELLKEPVSRDRNAV